MPGEAIVEDIPNLHGRTRTTCQMCGECDVGLQLRLQEHARLQLPHARQAPGRGDPHAGRRAALRAARGRRLHRPLRRPRRPAPPRRRRRSTLTCDHLILSARARSARPTCCCATARCCPGLSQQDRHPLLRQRRPADADPQHEQGHRRQARGADRRSGLRPGDHDDRAHPGRRGRRRGARLLPAGRRLPAAPRVDPARPRPRRSSSGAGARARRYLVKNWLKGSPDTDVTAQIADLMLPSELSAGGLPLLSMGRDIPDGRDVPAQRPAGHRLDAQGLRGLLRARAHGLARHGRRAGRALRRQPAVVPAPRDHRPPARRRADGPHTARRASSTRTATSSGIPGCTSPTARSCPDRPARTPALRSRRWQTASPTRSSIPTDAPRRRQPDELKRALHRGDARPHHPRRDRLRPRGPTGPRRLGRLQVPPHDRGGRHRAVQPGPAPARRGPRVGPLRCAGRATPGRATAGSTSSSTRRASRASSTCSTGSGSTTASATR